MVRYYGFILLVTFNKEFLSQRLGISVMTIGIPIGFRCDRVHHRRRFMAKRANTGSTISNAVAQAVAK
jgi:hypothetical protein